VWAGRVIIGDPQIGVVLAEAGEGLMVVRLRCGEAHQLAGKEGMQLH
jgi:hypothetical protein